MDSATLAKQLASYDTNRKSSTDVLNQAMSQYGIPEIRSRVSGLRATLTNTENALNNVDPSVTGRTQGSLVTEAQRQRQVASERAPIADQYGQQSRALGVESGNLSDSLSAAKLLADNQINDYNTGRSALQSQYDAANQREQADRSYQLEQAKFDEAKRQAATQAAGYSLGGGSTPKAPAAAAPTNPLQQDAYNDVRTRITSQNDAQLKSDYAATAKSAGYGNVRDKAKLEFYAALRPDLFGAVSANVLANGGQLSY